MLAIDIITNKLQKYTFYKARIAEELSKITSFEDFIKETLIQDSLLFNLLHLIQTCIDLASHVVARKEFGVAQSQADFFYILYNKNYFDEDILNVMLKITGFRNLLVHEYGKLDLAKAYSILTAETHVLDQYVESLKRKLGL